MKRIVYLLVSLSLSLLASGCAINSGGKDHVMYNDHKLLSEQAAKALPREQRLDTINEQMKAVGYRRIRVSHVFDSFTETVLGIFENQHKLMKQYKTLLDNHKDVMSFLMANKCKSDRELQQEINRFDAKITNPSEKIGPKIKAYEKASDKIWSANAKLTLQISAQALRLGVILYQANNREKDDPNALVLDVLTMLASANKTKRAYDLAEARLHLAKLANDFIQDEKAIIDISKELQKYQDKS